MKTTPCAKQNSMNSTKISDKVVYLIMKFIMKTYLKSRLNKIQDDGNQHGDILSITQKTQSSCVVFKSKLMMQRLESLKCKR